MYQWFTQIHVISCLFAPISDEYHMCYMSNMRSMDIAGYTAVTLHNTTTMMLCILTSQCFLWRLLYCDIISNSRKIAWWRTICNQDWINFCPGCGKVKEISIYFMNRYLMNCQHQSQHWAHGTHQLSRTQQRRFQLSTTAGIQRVPWWKMS